jgi:bifunctional UDP-N-acetylglucosamine pyrophosphorylase/glucosamine-1-phosphate N-acetyltransferase
MEKINVVILGAGKGTRMPESEIPKVMYKLRGKPMIQYLVEKSRKLGIKPIVVIGYRGEVIKKAIGSSANYVWQRARKGTGHAARMTEKLLKGEPGATIVLYGDMPLWSVNTLKQLIKAYEQSGATVVLVTVELPVEFTYGRIIRDKKGKILGIIEEKDCTAAQLRIKEKNSGLYIFNNQWLWENLPKIKNNNRQKEFYLTDLIEIAIKEGEPVETIEVANPKEAMGVNTLQDYKAIQRVAQ